MDESQSPSSSKPSLPAIPAKRYFTIGEVSELCGVKTRPLTVKTAQITTDFRRAENIVYGECQ